MDDQTLQMFEKVYEQQKRTQTMIEQLHQMITLVNEKVKVQQVQIETLEARTKLKGLI